MKTKEVILKVGNMMKPQEFTLYPYDGGDIIYLQSDKRFIIANLKTGIGKINNKNKNYPTSWDIAAGNYIEITLPEDTKTEIQSYLWHNNGQQGNINRVVYFDNQKLFSK